MSHNPDYPAWFSPLQHYLNASFQRRVIRVSGDETWCIATIKTLLKNMDSNTLWVSSHIHQALSPKQARTRLGQEYSSIVFDCRHDFDLDALGAISGTLVGGGVLFLITPGLEEWDLLKHSLYLQMVQSLLEQHPALLCLQQNHPPADYKIPATPNEYTPPADAIYKTVEQQKMVASITEHFLHDGASPLVLIADRGRGKSSSLGIAAAQLIQQGIKKIIVTAPRLSICEPLFFHAEKNLEHSHWQRGKLSTQKAEIQFKAPDVLLDEKPPAELLMIDEAAAIPLPMLKKMLHQYPAVIFSSTLYGYEGTGRGFILKFFKILNDYTNHWKKLSLQSPVRWAENDPLENWTDNLLCLHAELEDVADIDGRTSEDFDIQRLDKNALIQNNTQAKALFALLVSAHYRSRPSDFQFLLDNASVRIYTLSYQQKILAAAVINAEDGFDTQLAAAIYKGERRPSGRLLPQTLCFHGGIEAAARLNYSRIMRIAVHPDLQRQGLGSYLMKAVIKQEAGLSQMIGCSFAATSELIHFWKQLGFELVRMGFTRDHVSASHSAIMLQATSPQHQLIFQQLRSKFQNGISYWLNDSLKDLQEDLKKRLITESQAGANQISRLDWQDIDSFACYLRGYEACSPALHKFITQYAEQIELLDASDQQIINSRIKNALSWPETVQQCGLAGKNQALKNLRAAIGRLLQLVS